jgi:hypothetical protein
MPCRAREAHYLYGITPDGSTSIVLHPVVYTVRLGVESPIARLF